MIHEDKVFEKVVYAGQVVTGREFQNCVFKNCDLSESDFSGSKFIDCVFEGCNLSMIKLRGTTVSNALFKNCKVMGVIFSECHDFLFSVAFQSSVADYCSFMGRKMLKTQFANTSLKEVNFSLANLQGSVFDEADLMGALFNGTNLMGCNFATAHNYDIDPELNKVKGAIFSSQGLAGLLTRYGITIV